MKCNMETKYETVKGSKMPFKVTMIIEGDNEKQIKEIADMAQQLTEDIKAINEEMASYKDEAVTAFDSEQQ